MPIRLRPSSAVGGVAAGAFALASFGTGLAGAQTGEEEISITPSSGPPGTAISVTGSGCTGEVTALLLQDQTTIDSDTLLDVDGDWEASLTVPADEELRGWQLDVTASCIGLDPPDYGSATFVVDSGTPPTTDPTTPPTSPPTTQGPSAPPDGPPVGAPGGDATVTTASPATATTVASRGSRSMPAARPVAGQPNYTG
jgi:hypothetical protein